MSQTARTAGAVAAIIMCCLALVASGKPQAQGSCNLCNSTDWYCDGMCNDGSIRCNGSPQCSDRSDEFKCGDKCSGKGFFNCSNGECLAAKYVCDKRHHCLDGSDEINCKNATSYCSKYSSKRDPILPCGSSWYCFNQNNKCTGRAPDCPNGFDQQCNGTCKGSKKFICNDGACGAGWDRCKYPGGCTDGSDQWNCTSAECNHSWNFRCIGDGQCIWKKSKVCNGIDDCSDGSDENNCPKLATEKKFRCSDCLQILQKFKCDGTPHCKDHSDELSCDKTQCNKDNHRRCDNNECIVKTALCNGKPDCLDHSDEKNCGSACGFKDFDYSNSGQILPNQGFFFCKNGECTSGRCDGKLDCKDGTDEDNCHV